MTEISLIIEHFSTLKASIAFTYFLQKVFLVYIQFKCRVVGDGPEVVSYHHLGQGRRPSEQLCHIAVVAEAEIQNDHIWVKLGKCFI